MLLRWHFSTMGTSVSPAAGYQPSPTGEPLKLESCKSDRPEGKIHSATQQRKSVLSPPPDPLPSSGQQNKTWVRSEKLVVQTHCPHKCSFPGSLFNLVLCEYWATTRAFLKPSTRSPTSRCLAACKAMRSRGTSMTKETGPSFGPWGGAGKTLQQSFCATSSMQLLTSPRRLSRNQLFQIQVPPVSFA